MRDCHSSLRQEILDVAQAQAEPVIQPDGVADDLGREPVSTVALPVVAHHRTVPGCRFT